MPVALLILEALEELSNGDFQVFQWTLTQQVLEGCPPIKKCHLEKAPRHETASKMTETYGEELAVKVAVEVLRWMKQKNIARKLEEGHAGSAPAASASASATGASAPAAGASAGCTEVQSITVAPTIQGSNSGVCLNMNINTR